MVRISLTVSCLAALPLLLQCFPLHPQPYGASPSHSLSFTPLTQLCAKKRGRSILGDIAGDVSASPSRTVVKQRSTRKSKKERQASKKSSTNNESPSSVISPALAEWAAKQGVEAEVEDIPASPSQESTRASSDDADTFVKFEPVDDDEILSQKKRSSKRNNERRRKQSERKAIESRRSQEVQDVVKSLLKTLEEKNNNLDDILTSIRSLLSLSSDYSDFRQLMAASHKDPPSYRLAWVGSDEAICHLGTGLHKVPLARLQEVFLTLQGKQRMEILEVIRILGPFPNVKNILQGNTKLVRNPSPGLEPQENMATLKITMDKMVDGTGKEVKAGTEDNIRKVDLQIYFADEDALVAVVPPEDGVRGDPLEENGSHVLLFVKEDELDSKLDSLRVS